MCLQTFFVYQPCEYRRLPMLIISKYQTQSFLIGQWINWSITGTHISKVEDIVIILLDKYKTDLAHLLRSRLFSEHSLTLYLCNQTTFFIWEKISHS